MINFNLVKEAIQVKSAVVLEFIDNSKKVLFVDETALAEWLAFEINDAIALDDCVMFDYALIDSGARLGAKS